MILDETRDVLKKLAAFDQRTIGAGDIAAWHEVIGYLEVRDCLAAVAVHYRDQSTRAMPADIRKLATVERDRREARERQAAGRLALETAPTTRDRSADVAALVSSVAAALPAMDIHERARKRARAQRGRPVPPPPVRRREKPKPMKYPEPTDSGIAQLATRYLIDGHRPGDVSERLGVSLRWCQETAAKFGGAS